MKLSTIQTNKKPQIHKAKEIQRKSPNTESGVSEKIQSLPDKVPNSSREPKTISKMVYSYTPTYYSTLHESITSICKTILPFNFKKRRLPAAEQRLRKLQSDNLKWQQDSFHQMLNLMGLHKEGILSGAEVSAFRSHLLDTLIASPPALEQPPILRDKLLFLQELLYAKCISSEEYHSSKRPLLQRLAVQGVEIEARDVIVGDLPKDPNENLEEEWSDIDLKDENRSQNSNSKNKSSKPSSAMKQIKGATSVFGFVSSYKPGKIREEKSIFDLEASKLTSSSKHEGPIWDCHLKSIENDPSSILMPESFTPAREKENSVVDKAKRKPFKSLFYKEQREENGLNSGDSATKSAKKHWGFEGFKKWNKSDLEDETAPLPLNERSDSEAYSNSCQLVASPIGEGPDTKSIKRKLHKDGAPSDFFIDKVLGDKIKKELTRIQSELSTTNPNLKFSNDQIEAISTKLPVDKAELKNFFPKSWCDRYGDVVLDVVKKEFKDHVGEMESLRNEARERRNSNSKRWTTFDDDDSENFHPNLFSKNNTLFDEHNNKSRGSKLRSESALLQDQNPFWSPRNGSSMLA